eukprot:1147598-Pelagomonas_calceolata.AAC.5
MQQQAGGGCSLLTPIGGAFEGGLDQFEAQEYDMTLPSLYLTCFSSGPRCCHKDPRRCRQQVRARLKMQQQASSFAGGSNGLPYA